MRFRQFRVFGWCVHFPAMNVQGPADRSCELLGQLGLGETVRAGKNLPNLEDNFLKVEDVVLKVEDVRPEVEDVCPES